MKGGRKSRRDCHRCQVALGTMQRIKTAMRREGRSVWATAGSLLRPPSGLFASSRKSLWSLSGFPQESSNHTKFSTKVSVGMGPAYF